MDHNFIETWYRYRFGDADLLRQHVQDGVDVGETGLQAKYDRIRTRLYGGQEFQLGRKIGKID